MDALSELIYKPGDLYLYVYTRKTVKYTETKDVNRLFSGVKTITRECRRLETKEEMISNINLYINKHKLKIINIESILQYRSAGPSGYYDPHIEGYNVFCRIL